jgi:hypothetical protein
LHINPTGTLSVRPAAYGSDELAILAGWAGLPYRLYYASGEQLAQGIVSSNGRIERTAVPTMERMTLELGSSHSTEFLPLNSSEFEEPQCTDQDDPIKDEVDETWDDPAHRTPSTVTFKSTNSKTILIDAFLGADTAKALLSQFGVDPSIGN